MRARVRRVIWVPHVGKILGSGPRTTLRVQNFLWASSPSSQRELLDQFLHVLLCTHLDHLRLCEANEDTLPEGDGAIN